MVWWLDLLVSHGCLMEVRQFRRRESGVSGNAPWNLIAWKDTGYFDRSSEKGSWCGPTGSMSMFRVGTKKKGYE